MAIFEVTHHRPDNSDRDRRIQGLGGPAAGGWYRGLDFLISLIERGDQFWTTDAHGNRVWIIVRERNSRKYLKTLPDGLEPNNLLSLPQC